MDSELISCIIRPLFIREEELRKQQLEEFYEKLEGLLNSSDQNER